MSERPRPVMCPCCWHRETMTARQNERDADHSHIECAYTGLMVWSPGPHRGGACGNPGMPSRWDYGVWECGACGLRVTPEEAGILLDAVLRDSDPECDSITDDGSGWCMHADARHALMAGRCCSRKSRR